MNDDQLLENYFKYESNHRHAEMSQGCWYKRGVVIVIDSIHKRGYMK